MNQTLKQICILAGAVLVTYVAVLTSNVPVVEVTLLGYALWRVLQTLIP